MYTLGNKRDPLNLYERTHPQDSIIVLLAVLVCLGFECRNHCWHVNPIYAWHIPVPIAGKVGLCCTFVLRLPWPNQINSTPRS